MNKHINVCLMALPLFMLACMAIWIMSYHPQTGILDQRTSFIRHFLHMNLFQDLNFDHHNDTGFEESQLLPGDLLFGHHSDGSYGYWTHCAIYLGKRQCTQQNMSEGMYVGYTHDFKDYYEHVIVLRAQLSDEQRQQLCTFARQRSGTIFDMSARKHDPRLWTCAKLCWAAYQDIGIDLCPHSNYVLPDFLAVDKRLELAATFPKEENDVPAR